MFVGRHLFNCAVFECIKKFLKTTILYLAMPPLNYQGAQHANLTFDEMEPFSDVISWKERLEKTNQIYTRRESQY